MNPDQQALAAFALAETETPLAVTTNPLAIALGMRLVQAHPVPGRIVLHFQPQPLFVQGAGVLQGGALSAMADFALAFAAMLTLSPAQTAATSTLDLAFLRPARPGCYEATGEVIRRGRTLIFARAELRPLGDDRPVLAASSMLLVTPWPPPSS